MDGPASQKPGDLNPENPDSPAFARRLNATLERWAAFGFCGAVLIAQGDRVLLSGGYGKANHSAERPNTPQTLFDIGSLSKQFTATAVLALAEEGRLNLHGSISQALGNVPPEKEPISIHHLLAHLSGISEGDDDGTALSREDFTAQILNRPLANTPGSEYAYSNDGYSLLASIIEIVSGEPFERYLEGRLFKPAGMQLSTVSWDQTVAEKHLALGYGGYKDPLEGEDPRARRNSWSRRGSGNILSSIEELFLWYRALRSRRILSQHSLDEMLTHHTTAEADFLSYGYGWRLQETENGSNMVWHSGLDGAYSAMLRHYLEEDILLIFLSNLSIGGVPMREVFVPPSRSGPPASKLFPEILTRAPAFRKDENQLASYCGRYRAGSTCWLIAEQEDSRIVLRAEGQEAIDALFSADNESVGVKQLEANEDAERLAGCLWDNDCSKDELERIDPLGFAERNGADVFADWRRFSESHGVLREVSSLGTTGLRSRNPKQMATHVRLCFADGVLDEHVIWFAEDEIYWIPGYPTTFTIHFKPALGKGLIGFDLLKQGIYQAELSDDGTKLTIRGNGRTFEASREESI